MKIRMAAPVFVLIFTALSALCDQFQDFVDFTGKVSYNYKSAVTAPESEYAKEYEKYLMKQYSLALSVQRQITNLKLGGDFNFPGLSRRVGEIFKNNLEEAGYPSVKQTSRSRSGSANRGGKKKNNQQTNKNKQKDKTTPDSVLKILLSDIKELKKLEFTTDGGGQIAPEFETTRSFMEFQRLTAFFIKNHAEMFSGREPEKGFAAEFNRRVHRLNILAKELESKIRTTQNGAQRISLSGEVGMMLKRYNNLADYYGKRRKGIRKDTSGAQNPNSIRKDMGYSIGRINEKITDLKNMKFESDPPLKRDGSKHIGDPFDGASGGKKDYESMSAAELTSELLKRRERIYRSNASMDGIDGDTLRLFNMTLSRAEKKRFNGYLAEKRSSGMDNEIAVKSAVLRIYSERGRNAELSKKELISIFRKLDADEEKSKKK